MPMIVLVSFALFGLIRWRKVIYFEEYAKYILEAKYIYIYIYIYIANSWRNAMDILPSGITIIKNRSVVYQNEKTTELLNIPKDIAPEEQAIRV